MSHTYFDLVSGKLEPKTIRLNKGDNLFEQGLAVVNLYLIKTGSIKLIRNTVEGSPVIIHIAYSNETIAEASLFADHYHCTATAMVKTEVQLINKNKLLDYLESNPQAMKKLLILFSQQVRDLRIINEIKNIRSANERIMAFFRNEKDDNNEVKLSLSGKDIAHKIGIAHETYYRELKVLEEQGLLIKKANNRFLVTAN